MLTIRSFTDIIVLPGRVLLVKAERLPALRNIEALKC